MTIKIYDSLRNTVEIHPEIKEVSTLGRETETLTLTKPNGSFFCIKIEPKQNVEILP